MFLAGLGADCDDARELRLAALERLRRVAGFDAYAWLLTDPETEVGTSPLADVPCLPELPRLIGLKYRTTVNRWTQQASAVATLREATSGRLEESLLWRDLLSDYGVRDMASVVFRDRFGCWAFLDLWRTRGEYDDAETSALARVAPEITGALRRQTAASFALPATTTARERTGPIVLVLSPDLDVLSQTPETEPYLRALVPPDGDRNAVPAAAYNVGAQLIANEAGVDDHPPVARVHLEGGEWLTLRAARIGENVAVSIESASPAERLEIFARATGLTSREVELIGLLGDGSDTRSVARRMVVSEHTVQDHLKSIFAKTGVHSRGELLALTSGR